PNLTYGNFEEDLLGEDDADIYIEAVKEELDIKHSVWNKVKAVAKDDALFATNTSGIPIEYISKVFSDDARRRFFGMHFFNHSRIIKMVVIIPLKDTDEAVVNAAQDFAEDNLGKVVVVDNGVP